MVNTPPSSYEGDFYSWTLDQAQLLRSGKLDALDVNNLAEQLELLGDSLYDDLQSRLAQLMQYLLKIQTERRITDTWQFVIDDQRRQILQLLGENPGLRSRLAEAQAEAWLIGRGYALEETTLPIQQFPEECPYSLELVLNDNWFPQ